MKPLAWLLLVYCVAVAFYSGLAMVPFLSWEGISSVVAMVGGIGLMLASAGRSGS